MVTKGEENLLKFLEALLAAMSDKPKRPVNNLHLYRVLQVTKVTYY